MNKKIPKCKQHNSPVQIICNYKDCQDRGMCLICDHNHVFLKTVKQSIPIYYSKFVKKLNASIDNILASTFQKQKQTQYKNKIILINSYFNDALQYITKLFQEKRRRVLGLLENDSDDVAAVLRKYRIDGDYLSVNKDDWKLLMGLYEGNEMEQYYLEKNEAVHAKIDQQLGEIRQMMKQFEEKSGLGLKDKIPNYPEMAKVNSKQIMKQQGTKNKHTTDSFLPFKQYKNRILLQTSKIQYDSILTDGIYHNSLLYTTSYDKKLRVISKDLILLKQIEFNNTLECLIQISENQMVLSISKQLSVFQITDDHSHQIKELMRLRGHEQKIKSIDNMNKRIIASSGSDCVYIWDLYKDNQSYTIREKESPSVVGFIKNAKKVVVGYSDWNAKVFDVETLRRLRTVELPGVPLVSLKVDENVHYLGGFPNVLAIIDSRTSQPIKHQVGIQALTCMKNAGGLLGLGNRESKVHLFDIRQNRSVVEWQAHEGMTHWDKPNGIANLDFAPDGILYTFGVNDKLIKKWELI